MGSYLRRRDVLAGISTGVLAGCLKGQSGTDISVSLEATVMQSFGAANPARLRLSFTNRSDHLVLLSPGVMQGIDGPLTAIRGHRSNGDRELLLFYRGTDLDSYVLCAESTETPIPAERIEGCWQTRCGEGLEIITAHGPIALEAGESLSSEYTLLDGFDDGCLRPGTYEFKDTTAISRARQTDESVESISESSTLVRRLMVTLADDGSVSATAQALVGTESDTPADTPVETPQQE